MPWRMAEAAAPSQREELRTDKEIAAALCGRRDHRLGAGATRSGRPVKGLSLDAGLLEAIDAAAEASRTHAPRAFIASAAVEKIKQGAYGAGPASKRSPDVSHLLKAV